MVLGINEPHLVYAQAKALDRGFVGYGVTQKGYRCLDPIHNKLYTTMDCEFFEESYYFSELGPQGESIGDDLS